MLRSAIGVFFLFAITACSGPTDGSTAADSGTTASSRSLDAIIRDGTIQIGVNPLLSHKEE